MLHLCRSYPCPGCVASGVDLYDCYFQFFHFLCEFWINLAFFQITSQCVNVLMHLWLGLIGFFLSTFIVDISLDTLFKFLGITWAYHVMPLCVTYVVIGLTIVALQYISFLIRSFLILRLIHLKILISMVFIL